MRCYLASDTGFLMSEMASRTQDAYHSCDSMWFYRYLLMLHPFSHVSVVEDHMPSRTAFGLIEDYAVL
ncbi:uncharacterized protein YALI1_E21020g [Yarrowia lipolytica]|uniref:Uncharacterized protein n=1 Tax=Yarrowia lipolytica TaxID=4952 RepID=A0A1D8NIU4_YARLL|nr:hypothetical protein YALI1_E21020g [Yarrowia lipolytica]